MHARKKACKEIRRYRPEKNTLEDARSQDAIGKGSAAF